jgi:hypothetical protein
VKKKEPATTIRSSTAEYLTFVAAAGDQPEAIEVRYEDENIWLTQRMMASLYGVTVKTINEHIQTIYGDGELPANPSTIRNFRIVQTEGSRQVEREVIHYNLQLIVAVGFKVNNPRAVQFRKWAGQIVKDYTIQGWVMDVDRLKKGHMFTDEYFDRQLEVIREIRLSERKFYQKITDLYTSAFDYDAIATTTKRFFALVQNKLHWAVHRHTAAELIVERADASKAYMGLHSWENAPLGKIVKSDVFVAKNYLNEAEMDHLQRIVSMYLDYAELQAIRKVPMSMEDWATRLDGFLEFNEHDVLIGSGQISHQQAKLHAETEFEKYRITQDQLFHSDFDRFLEMQSTSKELGEVKPD